MVSENFQRKQAPFIYKGENLNVVHARYCNTENSALLLETVAGGSFGCITVDPLEHLPLNFVAVKDYSENTGILHKLIAQGILSEPEMKIRCGFLTVPVCRIIHPALIR